jgi:hypothetical protein
MYVQTTKPDEAMRLAFESLPYMVTPSLIGQFQTTCSTVFETWFHIRLHVKI